ncbi:MAG: HEAT repeat domain-containing protein [Caldilineales bacterium]
MIESTAQAIAAMNNPKLSENERSAATRYLRDNPSAEGNAALVAALEDDDHGVRYAASSALAYIGEPAMPALLEALAKPDNDKVVRDGAHRVISENSSPRVREYCGDLLAALKGPQAGIASMQEAVRLMSVFR